MIYACFSEPGTKKRGKENSFISAYCVYVCVGTMPMLVCALCVCVCVHMCGCVCVWLAGRWGIVKIMDCT